MKKQNASGTSDSPRGELSLLLPGPASPSCLEIGVQC